MANLTPKQQRFVKEYLVDLNATQAAIRAGYSAKTAESAGSRLLRNVKVQAAIQQAMADRLKRTEIDADYVLNRLVEIDQMDCIDILTETGELKPISEWPKVWRQFISGFEVSELFAGSGDERAVVGMLKKIKWPDKVKNLELIGRHVTVQAFSDKTKMEHSGPNGGPIERKPTQQEIEDAIKAISDKV